MRKLLAVIALSSLICITGCAEKNESTSSESEISVVSDTENVEREESLSLSVNGSTKSFPLDINTWGTAAKYEPETDTYINVPVRIINIITGTEAQEIFHSFTSQSSSCAYVEPPEGCEWIIAEYEISLENYPVPKGGVTPDIVSSVTSYDGSSFILDGKRWKSVTTNISDDEYYFEGIIKGQIAYMMIKDTDDYIIVLGENGENQAFFKAK